MKNTFEQLVEALKLILQNEQSFIPLHEPVFKGNEWEYVKECIDTSWVSSVGKFVDKFERDLAEYTGVKRAVAVVNGTAALHIALKIAGVRADDEVLIPTVTFVATANAVVYCNAIPHFVESETRTLGLDPFALENYLEEITEIKNGDCYNKITNRRIKAVVPMHTFGHPVDIDPLIEVCKKFRLELVEDAAESLGSFYKGKHTGGFGKAAAMSFNGNKIITTGGGGAILTNDEKLADFAKHLTTTAKVPHQWEYIHDNVGYNYRMPNINAALGCAQLENLDRFIEKKRQLTEKYAQVLNKIEGVSLFQEASFVKSNYWLQTLVLNNANNESRNNLLTILNENNIMARPIWKPMHKLEIFQNCPSMPLDIAEKLENSLINLPSGVNVGG